MAQTEAFFLPAAKGQRFCLHHPAAGTRTKAALIYLHPFAEEMNKSRRMAARQARLLAEQGYAVLQIDLFGCGDSSGDFGDAGWQDWLDDVQAAHAWLRARYDCPCWLWGLRAGCLLAAEAVPRLGETPGFLFWNPVISGKQALQQFLRLKVVGEMLSGEGKGVMAELQQQLADGIAPEIAGYRLTPALANGLAAAELSPPPGPPCQVIWLELSLRPEATFSTASQQGITRWLAAGHIVKAQIPSGPAFWQTSEIEEAPAMLAATLTAMEKLAR